MLKFITKVQIRAEERLAALEGQEGAAMVEYGLLVAFIAIIALVGVKALGVNLNNLFAGIKF